MKNSWLLLPTFVLFFLVNSLYGQNNCPALPKKTSFDTLAYIKAEIPTDPARPLGLWLGQGIVKRGPTEFRPGYIPSNKPSWAIATAVAWNYARNIDQRVEYPKIGYWMATLVQETELRCATGLTWSAPAQVPVAYDPATVYAAQINNGCLQIEGPTSAYSALQQAYPYGRFPTANYHTLMEGVDGYEASALVKTYYDSYTGQIFNYNMGWNFYKNIDCKDQYDAYAYEKMTASNYNGGPNAFLAAKTILDNTGPGCWTGLPASTAGYANDIAKWISVFENNTGYCDYPTGSTWGGYYNDNMTWAAVTHYLGIIDNMYPEINFATDVIPSVQAAFVAKAGSLAGTIPFQQFGSVIDAIVLKLPLERPNYVEGSPSGGALNCSGATLPYGHVEILDGSTTMCLGNSVTLELVVDAGGGTAPTYKWFANSTSGTLLGTGKTITITPTSTGVFRYAAQICNSAGCYTVYSNNQNACQDPRNVNGFKVTVTNCSACSFTASATSVNTPCTGMNAGKINLTLTNAPASYKVTYTANTPLGPVSKSFNTSGSTVAIDSLRDGSYNIVLEDLSNPACKAYTNRIVNYTTAVNEYIDAKKVSLSADKCMATVKADLKELPAPCNWKVQTYVDNFFQWENQVNVGLVTSTGISTLDKYNRVAMKPEIDLYNNVQLNEQIMTLNTGDRIDVYIALTVPAQAMPYTTRIYDENNVLVSTIVAPAGASNSGPYHAGSYTVTCPTPALPAYTYTWSPALNTVTNTAKASNGTININFVVPTTYTITAQHPSNAACKLTDTLIIQPTCPTALPVNFVSFNAFLLNEQAVQLDWSTAMEENASYFQVERSTDGMHFLSLGTVVAAGYSSSLQNYHYVDHYAVRGTVYYRIAEYDVNGTKMYSGVKAVYGSKRMSLTVYPNPSVNSFNVFVESEEDEKINLVIYDVLGHVAERKTISSNSITVVGETLARGAYILHVQKPDETLSIQKLIKE